MGIQAVSGNEKSYAALYFRNNQKVSEGKDHSASKETVDIATGKNDVPIWNMKTYFGFMAKTQLGEGTKKVDPATVAVAANAGGDSIFSKQQNVGANNHLFNFGVANEMKSFTRLNPSQSGSGSSDKQDNGGHQLFAFTQTKANSGTLEKERYDKLQTFIA